MIRDGIVEEVKALLDTGCTEHDHALGAIGYKEICEHIRGGTGLDETIALIQRNTRRLAKRQMTWFRKMPDIRWFHHPYPIERMVGDIERFM